MVLERLRDLSGLANAVGLMMVGRTQQAFRAQGRGGQGWAGRGVPNRIGVLEDLRAGRVPPARRFEARPAAIDTGRLRSSIAFKVDGNTVTIGSALDYASDVQKGSTKTITLDQQLRRALASWLKTHKDQRKNFGFLFQTGSLSVTVPPRPYLVLTDQDKRDIAALARRFVHGGKP